MLLGFGFEQRSLKDNCGVHYFTIEIRQSSGVKAAGFYFKTVKFNADRLLFR